MRAYLLQLLSFFSLLFSNAHAIPLDLLKLQPGYKVEVYAEGIAGARQLALGDKGTVFVGSKTNSVYAILKEGSQTRVITIATGLNKPNGVVFRNGSLYVAEVHRIRRYDNIESRLENPPSPVFIHDLPSQDWHSNRYIRFGYDNKLYVGVGIPCNTCLPPTPIHGTLMRMNADGSEFEIFAKGVRNTGGFDWNPITKQLWFTENGRDNLGDDIPPDKLDCAPHPGMHFGFPYYNGKGLPDPVYGSQFPESDFTMPTYELPAHVAPLGMKFYQGNMFPNISEQLVFLAEHGSWNRSKKIGYQVLRVLINNGTVISSEPFITGWLQGETAWGRPVDIYILKDGSMLISDDTANVIYRVTYVG